MRGEERRGCCGKRRKVEREGREDSGGARIEGERVRKRGKGEGMKNGEGRKNGR